MSQGLGLATPTSPRRLTPQEEERRRRDEVNRRQDADIKRFQEQKRREEQERARREQEYMRRRGEGRPEDPIRGPDGRPQWRYPGGPRVAGRTTADTVRTLDRIPGPHRTLTGPGAAALDEQERQRRAAQGQDGGAREPFPPGRAGRPPAGPPKRRSPGAPWPQIDPNWPAARRAEEYKKRMHVTAQKTDRHARAADEARRRGDREGEAAAIRDRNQYDQEYQHWRRQWERDRQPPPPGKSGSQKGYNNRDEEKRRAGRVAAAKREYYEAQKNYEAAIRSGDPRNTTRARNRYEGAREKMRDAAAE